MDGLIAQRVGLTPLMHEESRSGLQQRNRTPAHSAWRGVLLLMALAGVAISPGWLSGNPPQEPEQLLKAGGLAPAFYPTLLFHLLLPEPWASALDVLTRLLMAGAGAWLLAGRYGISPRGRAFCGAAFMLGAYSMTHLSHPRMNVMPLLPWAIFGMELLIERVTGPRVWLASIVLLVQFLGGWAQASVSMGVTIAAAWLLHLIVRPHVGQPGVWGDRACCAIAARVLYGRRTLLAGVAMVLALVVAVAAAGVYWVPSLTNAGPGLLGQVQTNSVDRSRVLHGILCGYVDRTGTDSAAWVGTLPLLFALLSLVAKPGRRVIYWVLLAAASMLLAIWPPRIHAAADAGMLRQAAQALTGLVGGEYLLVGTALGLAMLAGMGFDVLLGWLGRTGPSAASSADRLRQRRRADAVSLVAWSCIAVASIELLAFGLPHSRGMFSGSWYASSAAGESRMPWKGTGRVSQVRFIASTGFMPANHATDLRLAGLRPWGTTPTAHRQSSLDRPVLAAETRWTVAWLMDSTRRICVGMVGDNRWSTFADAAAAGWMTAMRCVVPESRLVERDAQILPVSLSQAVARPAAFRDPGVTILESTSPVAVRGLLVSLCGGILMLILLAWGLFTPPTEAILGR